MWPERIRCGQLIEIYVYGPKDKLKYMAPA